ncbi:hypothetical protein J1N35_029415 [Gossypium stocksii]|uniref:Uncharacterized protein n=1 Tax=Gossypium stocksii TaxID=47602 RepID=A0A9D3UXQ5_9ROSI|nr:hypothetical protein J1N35_029415 [Gossypium stocksii]
MGSVSPSIFTSSNGLPVYISTRNKFKWTPYQNPVIRVVNFEECFVNLNAWHVKVSLVIYVTVKMHEADRLLQQFKFR